MPPKLFVKAPFYKDAPAGKPDGGRNFAVSFGHLIIATYPTRLQYDEKRLHLLSEQVKKAIF